jgi:hypothetical protein
MDEVLEIALTKPLPKLKTHNGEKKKVRITPMPVSSIHAPQPY